MKSYAEQFTESPCVEDVMRCCGTRRREIVVMAPRGRAFLVSSSENSLFLSNRSAALFHLIGKHSFIDYDGPRRDEVSELNLDLPFLKDIEGKKAHPQGSTSTR